MDLASAAIKPSLPLELWELIFPAMISTPIPVNLDFWMERLGIPPVTLTDHEWCKIRPVHTLACTDCLNEEKERCAQRLNKNDWLVANLIRRAWRPYNRRVFFERKRFTIRPVFVERLARGECKFFDASFGVEAVRYIQHVIAPIPACSLIYDTLAVAQFQQFQQLKRLTFALMSQTAVVNGKEKWFEMPEQIKGLFEGLGLDMGAYEVDAIFGDVKKARARVYDLNWTLDYWFGGQIGFATPVFDIDPPELKRTF